MSDDDRQPASPWALPQQPVPWGDSWNAWPQPPRGRDGFAIAAVILGVLPVAFGLLGVAFGIAALRRIKRLGGSGRGLAVAGIVCGGCWCTVIAIGFTVNHGDYERSHRRSAADRGHVTTEDLRVGDCTADVPSGRTLTVEIVPCLRPHAGEVFAVFDLPDGSYPGDDDVRRLSEGGCLSRLASYVGAEPGKTGYDVAFLRPLRDSWAVNRTAECLLHAPDDVPLAGTARGAGPYGR
jgi:hypothetical protein